MFFIDSSARSSTEPSNRSLLHHRFLSNKISEARYSIPKKNVEMDRNGINGMK
jgi:hypothetical protein